MRTQLAPRHRTPLELLVSDALYRIQETLAVFPEAVLLGSEGSRHEALCRLLRSEQLELPVVDRPEYHQVVLSSQLEPPDSCGTPFGWGSHESDFPLMVYPLANWNDGTIEAFGGARNDFCGDRRLLKVCVVGDSDSGKSDLIEGLISGRQAGAEEDPRPRCLWTESRLLILREIRGKHASDLAVTAGGWESDWAVLTVDAEIGLNAVTKRLLFLLALSGVPQLVVVVTRLNVTGRPQEAYRRLLQDINHLLSSTSRLNLTGVIPQDAEEHDWYRGETLAMHLERLALPRATHLETLRLSVQRQNRGKIHGYLHGGSLSPGDKVVSLPSGDRATVEALRFQGGDVEKSFSGDSLLLFLDRDINFEVGGWLVSEESLPVRSSELDATLLWVDDHPPEDPRSYRLYHCSRMVDAQLAEVASCLQPDSYEWSEGDHLQDGKVGHVSLLTGSPLYFDSFFQNRTVGRFLLLHHERPGVTGVGIIRGRLRKRRDVTSTPERLASEHVVVDSTEVSLQERRNKYGHRGAVLWFTGLSGSGKSAVAKETEKKLFERGCHTLFLDGDNVRTGFNGDLGFTQEERSESNRRVAELAALAHGQGQIVICSFISGNQEDRDFVRSLVKDDFYLCFVDCPVAVCRERDPKGLYEKADAGELLSFTGVSIPYDRPSNPELVLDSDAHRPEALTRKVVEMLESRGVI